MENGNASFCGRFTTVCRSKDGKIKWIDDSPNIVTDEGLSQLLRYLCNDTSAGSGSVGIPNQVYVILNVNNSISGGSGNGAWPGDSFKYSEENGTPSTSGEYFSEGTGYDLVGGVAGREAVDRPTWAHDAIGTDDTSTTNSDDPADFYINATMAVYGAGLVFSPTGQLANVKGDTLSTNILYNISNFSSVKNVSDGDQLSVTVAITASSS